jgi:hypothetical protein
MCARYKTEKYCTPHGTYGEGWEPSFATFDIWATEGFDALTACCECGGGSTAGDPTAEDLSEDFHYMELGKGYCGATKEEELSNRISQWFFDRTMEDAETSCNADENCEGFHWNGRNGHFILVGKVGFDTCCNENNKSSCYKKHKVTAPPTKGPTIQGLPYNEVGPGYCGQTVEEEIGNRLGSWVYAESVNGTKEAGDACTETPQCRGFHWNEYDKSYILLSKVGHWTCCQSEKGDLCFRRLDPYDGPVMQEAEVEGQVVFSVKVTNLEFFHFMKSFVEALKDAIAAEAGVPTMGVDVMISSATALQVTVSPPQGTRSRDVQSTLGSSTTITQTIKEHVRNADGIGGIAGDFSIDVTAPKVQAVFSGKSARAQLDEAHDRYEAPPTTTTMATFAPQVMPGEFVNPFR